MKNSAMVLLAVIMQLANPYLVGLVKLSIQLQPNLVFKLAETTKTTQVRFVMMATMSVEMVVLKVVSKQKNHGSVHLWGLACSTVVTDCSKEMILQLGKQMEYLMKNAMMEIMLMAMVALEYVRQNLAGNARIYIRVYYSKFLLSNQNVQRLLLHSQSSSILRNNTSEVLQLTNSNSLIIQLLIKQQVSSNLLNTKMT